MLKLLVEQIDVTLTNARIAAWVLWAKFCKWFIFCCPECGMLLKQCKLLECGIIWCPNCVDDIYCPGWEGID